MPVVSAISICLIQGLHSLGAKISQALALLLTVPRGLFWFQALRWPLQCIHDLHLWAANGVHCSTPGRPSSWTEAQLPNPTTLTLDTHKPEV